jgi:hypothetical protein
MLFLNCIKGKIVVGYPSRILYSCLPLDIDFVNPLEFGCFSGIRLSLKIPKGTGYINPSQEYLNKISIGNYCNLLGTVVF